VHPHRTSIRQPPPRHPRPEPTGDVGRKMTDRFAGAEVDPDLRLVLDRRVGDEADRIPFLEGIELPGPVTEHGAVHRRPEMGGPPFGKRGHIRHVGACLTEGDRAGFRAPLTC